MVEVGIHKGEETPTLAKQRIPGAAEYFAGEPDFSRLQRAAIMQADVSPDKIKNWRWQARLKALEREVRELRRAVRQLGLRGLRVLPWLWTLPPNDRRYYPLYAECVELGIPFCLQVGHAGPLCPSEPGRPIPYLDDVALEFPELVIVAGHIGYPWTDEMIALATKYPNVYIDSSAYKPSRYPASFVAYLGGHGRRKVLFGSNFPMLLPGSCLDQLPALGLDDEATRLFLHDNAARVFGLTT